MITAVVHGGIGKIANLLALLADDSLYAKTLRCAYKTDLGCLSTAAIRINDQYGILKGITGFGFGDEMRLASLRKGIGNTDRYTGRNDNNDHASIQSHSSPVPTGLGSIDRNLTTTE
jgi:hypothetical protein